MTFSNLTSAFLRQMQMSLLLMYCCLLHFFVIVANCGFFIFYINVLVMLLITADVCIDGTKHSKKKRLFFALVGGTLALAGIAVSLIMSLVSC